MWTSTLDLDPTRVLLTQLLSRVWSGAIFSSLAPLQVQNLPRQQLPEKTWVRVRNRLAGICGSDLHMLQGDGDFRIAPAALPLHRRSYPGHEVIGEVLEVGEDTQYIRVGDRVVLQYGSNCISAGVQTPCRSCAHGYYNLCEYGKLPGPDAIGGGWSEEMLLPEQQLFRLPADISDEQAVMLEPTAVALHAVLRHLPQPNERVLIVGAGTIGLLTLQIVRALAPQAEISVLARHSFQVEQATRQGAAHIIYPQDSYSGIQRATHAQLFKGMFNNQVLLGGYDVIFDTVGTHKTLHHALRWARAQATVVLVGVNLHQMQLDLTPVWYREINLIGSIGSSVETWPPTANEKRSTFEITAELIRHGQIHPEYLITHRFPLNNFQTALLTAIKKEQSHAIKVIFDYSLLPPSVVPNVRASATRKRRSHAIDENTSLPEHQNISKSAPLPERLTEPASPMATLSTLFSASHTVAPALHEDNELDEMEDTISAPAIVKYNKLPVINQQQKEQPLPAEEAAQPELEVTPLETALAQPLPLEEAAPSELEVTPLETALAQPLPLEEAAPSELEVTPLETASAQPLPLEEAAPSELEVTPLETASEIQILDSGEHADETDITDDTLLSTSEEPSTTTVNIIQVAGKVDETSIETAHDSSILPLPSTQEATRHFPDIPKEAPEYFPDVQEETTEYFPDFQEETPEYFPDFQEETPEYFPDGPIDASFFSEEPSIAELPETSPPFVEDALPSDSIMEKETDTISATENPENTLLHTDRPPSAKVQNRPRPRTRKKNNRNSVERQ